MRTFTLDTNCILAIDEGRSEASAIRALADAHAVGTAHVAVVTISASERQQGGGHLQSITAFLERLARLDLGHLDILDPMAYADVAYLDWCLLSDEGMEELERRIHAILFPTVEFRWQDYCDTRGFDPAAPPTDRKWRNAKCDVQAIWSHMHRKRDVFVTSDGNFHLPTNKVRLIALGANRIEYPVDAVALI
jgi:hypothetical protein